MFCVHASPLVPEVNWKVFCSRVFFFGGGGGVENLQNKQKYDLTKHLPFADSKLV